jgi:hypothetical protein
MLLQQIHTHFLHTHAPDVFESALVVGCRRVHEVVVEVKDYSIHTASSNRSRRQTAVTDLPQPDSPPTASTILLRAGAADRAGEANFRAVS